MNKKELYQTSGLALGAFALIATLGFPPTPRTAKANESPKPVSTVEKLPGIQQLNTAFADLSENLSPSVVNIYTKSKTRSSRPLPPGFPGSPHGDFDFFFENPMGAPRSNVVQALGSGFVLDHDGYIVTNSHVIQMAGRQAEEVMVKFMGEDNTQGTPAKIIGFDEATDVAVLKLSQPRSDLKPVVLGDSDKSRVGEWVLAIGNPYGHTNTVTQGIISARARSLEGVRSDFLQTSASINPGNSGGPLFNMNGEVVGINTAIDPRAQGIGFAIPVNTAKSVIAQLKDKGRVERAWLGIAVQDIPQELSGYLKMKEPQGVLVREVMEGAPASKAGLQPFDVIVKLDSKDIRNSRELMQTIEKIPVGNKANVQVLRNNQVRDLEVTVSEMPRQQS